MVKEFTDKLLSNVGIGDDDVFCIISDNASNFIKAFKVTIDELVQENYS